MEPTGFGFFKEEWGRYDSASNVKEANLLQDQLLHCADLQLRKTLQNTIGLKMTVMELMAQLEKAAVERQSDLLNKVRKA